MVEYSAISYMLWPIPTHAAKWTTASIPAPPAGRSPGRDVALESTRPRHPGKRAACPPGAPAQPNISRRLLLWRCVEVAADRRTVDTTQSKRDTFVRAPRLRLTFRRAGVSRISRCRLPNGPALRADLTSAVLARRVSPVGVGAEPRG